MVKLKEALTGKINPTLLQIIPTSFDMVGDLAIFADIPDELKNREKLIGETLLSLSPHIKVVLKKVANYSGEYRTPKLRIIAGERRKTTELIESGCRLRLHAQNVYFSPRSGHERLRIASLVKSDEEVLVMFSGVGPYPLILSKKSKAGNITSVEANPDACLFQQENIKLNKISNVKFICGDVRKVIPKLHKQFDRIAMPLPHGGEDFLNIAFLVIKKGGIVHFYDFLHENDFELGKKKIKDAAKDAGLKCRILRLVKCGHLGPGKFRVCIDAKIS